MAQIDRTSPKWFLATTVKAEPELLVAASTFSLMQPEGGGDQVLLLSSFGGWIAEEKTNNFIESGLNVLPSLHRIRVNVTEQFEIS